MPNFPLEVRAIRIEQPLGVYYVTTLNAETLLQVAFSDATSAMLRSDNEGYVLDGTQRMLKMDRLQSIADYINRPDSAFPNTIILAANFRQTDGLIEGDQVEQSSGPENIEEDIAGAAEAKRWTVKEEPNGCWTLKIPSPDKLAAIIDGQHRLFSFTKAAKDRKNMMLICAVFLDLPKPYQAQLFATINSTQKAVNKSLTYELFGYNIEEEKESFWSPDKLAVFLTRRLTVDPKSPLHGRVQIAPMTDVALAEATTSSEWKVSTAVVVEGIMRLYTTNPKKDTANLLDGYRKERSTLRGVRKDRSPLRELYLGGQDLVIYEITLNYLKACDEVFWKKASVYSFITRTIGVQALFDVLWKISKAANDNRDISCEYFQAKIANAGGIDFSREEYRSASGSGRSVIRRAIEAAMDL